MNHEELKFHIGSNITANRKRLGMTQAELAQRLNYSDKAVSKWERGESVPDVLTLADIAQQFGVTVNDLIYGTQPSDPELPQPAVSSPAAKKNKAAKTVRHYNRNVIQHLVSVLVWIVATAIYVLLDSFDLPYGWLIFFVAVPAHAITLLSLRSAWGLYRLNPLLISVIMWGSLVCLHAILYISTGVNTWRVFLLGVLGQIAIILWFKLLKKPKEEVYGQEIDPC